MLHLGTIFIFQWRLQKEVTELAKCDVILQKLFRKKCAQ